MCFQEYQHKLSMHQSNDKQKGNIINMNIEHIFETISILLSSIDTF